MPGWRRQHRPARCLGVNKCALDILLRVSCSHFVDTIQQRPCTVYLARRSPTARQNERRCRRLGPEMERSEMTLRQPRAGSSVAPGSVRCRFPRGGAFPGGSPPLEPRLPRTLARLPTLSDLPSVDRLLAENAVVPFIRAHGRPLVLDTLARCREVPVSRGELIGIGSAFRIPDIIAPGPASRPGRARHGKR